MKHFYISIVLTLGLGLTTLFGQSIRSMDRDEWLLSVGVNAINSQGTKSPLGNISDWAFRFPLTVGVETYATRLFSVEVVASLNGYKEGAAVDAGPAEENLTYFALDAHAKYYFGEFIFPNYELIDFYALAGLGYFNIVDGNASANFGGGALYWFDRGQQIGIKLQGLAKVAFNHRNTGSTYANNHFQYNLTLVFRL